MQFTAFEGSAGRGGVGGEGGHQQKLLLASVIKKTK